MANFTTWQTAYENLLNIFVSSNVRVGSVTVDGNTITYKSNEDFLRLLNYAERKAAFETGSYAPRVYAKNGGKASC